VLHGANGSENLRATDQSIDRRIGYWSNGYDLRSPPGIASTDETVLVTGSDTRLAEGAQVQDVFTSVVQLGELPSDGKAGGRYLLAGMGGLAAGGLLLFVASRVLGRRRRAEGDVQPTS
jgi:hypothetical protein